MYVCICARVRENEVRTAIRCGARSEESVGDACGAGTSCGTCVDRICDLIEEVALGEVGGQLEQTRSDTLLPLAA